MLTVIEQHLTHETDYLTALDFYGEVISRESLHWIESSVCHIIQRMTAQPLNTTKQMAVDLHDLISLRDAVKAELDKPQVQPSREAVWDYWRNRFGYHG